MTHFSKEHFFQCHSIDKMHWCYSKIIPTICDNNHFECIQRSQYCLMLELALLTSKPSSVQTFSGSINNYDLIASSCHITNLGEILAPKFIIINSKNEKIFILNYSVNNSVQPVCTIMMFASIPVGHLPRLLHKLCTHSQHDTGHKTEFIQ